MATSDIGTPGCLARNRLVTGKMKIEYHPIGIIRSLFEQIEGMPIQSAGASSIQGRVDVFPEYAEGLKDLDGFSHVILLYHFHRVKDSALIVTPFCITTSLAPATPNRSRCGIARLCDAGQIESYPAEVFEAIAQRLAQTTPAARSFG